MPILQIAYEHFGSVLFGHKALKIQADLVFFVLLSLVLTILKQDKKGKIYKIRLF